MKNNWQQLFYNAQLLMADGTLMKNGALAIKTDKVIWLGSSHDIDFKELDSSVIKVDCQNKVMTPGLIDCHTHLVYAGTRANEFEMRLKGLSYAEIAKAGGGIKATVKATREASEEALFIASLPRLQALKNEGVTTCEIKSGYGLTLEDEIKMLKVANRLADVSGVNVITTFLGAHALPVEYQGRADDYMTYVCEVMLPEIKALGLATMVDVFCESIGFTLKQTERVLKSAHDMGFKIKCHAEQLSNLGGSQLAASLGALSVEHLEYIDEDSIKEMADKGTVAVLLPGAFYYLKEQQLPPIDLFRKHQVPMAIATDCNPGSSPCSSLLLMMNMACVLFGLTVQECLQAVTVNAAKALGLENRLGHLAVGSEATFVLWDTSNMSELCYFLGKQTNGQLFIKGKKVSG